MLLLLLLELEKNINIRGNITLCLLFREETENCKVSCKHLLQFTDFDLLCFCLFLFI